MKKSTFLLVFLLGCILLIASTAEHDMDHEEKTRREQKMDELKHEADSLSGILPSQRAIARVDSLIKVIE